MTFSVLESKLYTSEFCLENKWGVLIYIIAVVICILFLKGHI